MSYLLAIGVHGLHTNSKWVTLGFQSIVGIVTEFELMHHA